MKLTMGLAVAVMLLGVILTAESVSADARALPEPTSFTLLGLGLAGLVGYGLYSKRR
jgi:hypothetical protein